MFREYRKATPGCNALKTLSITATVLIQKLISQISKQCSQTHRMEPLEKLSKLRLLQKRNYQMTVLCKLS